MSIQSTEAAWNVSQAIADVGRTATFRHVSALPPPNAATNPASTSALVMASGAAQGASVIALSAPAVTGYLAPGDALVIAGDPTTYTVVAANIAAANRFPAVQITPALAHAASLNTAVAVTYAGDYQVRVITSSYTSAMIAAGTASASDIRVLMAVTDVNGAPLPLPDPPDRIIVDGRSRAVGSVTVLFAGSTVVAYDIQAQA